MRITDDERRAGQLTVAENRAFRKLAFALEPIAFRYLYEHQQERGAFHEPTIEREPPEPSPEQFQSLRERYIEYRAIKSEADKKWAQIRTASPLFEIWAKAALVAYRLILLAAALSILYVHWLLPATP
jgi:hypothetical protein